MAKMKAAIFVEPGRIVLDDKPVPDVGPLDALMRPDSTKIAAFILTMVCSGRSDQRGAIGTAEA